VRTANGVSVIQDLERAIKHAVAQPESRRQPVTGGELDAWDLTPDPFPKGKGNL